MEVINTKNSSSSTIVLLIPFFVVLAALAMMACNKAEPEQASGQAEESGSEIKMILIPAGHFMMGSERDIDTKPVAKVSVDAFYMDATEVTQEIYEKIIEENPSRILGRKDPVEQVTWLDAIKFCNARSKSEGLEVCYDMETRTCNFEANGYRLPTEAEWEYACRAGEEGNYYFGSDPSKLKANGWFKGNSRNRHHAVGMKAPNAFGLYDMSGNVQEWCNDWYGVRYYRDRPESNPRGPDAGEKKVLRGGCWNKTAESCSNWIRDNDYPGFDDACIPLSHIGFRCVRKATARP